MTDYDLRGPDWDTILVGPVTDIHMDADRIVRDGRRGEPGWSNGFPNWTMYRVAYAGDTHGRLALRDFCVAFAVAHCEAGGVRNGLPAEEIGCLAGWDAFYALLNHKWLIAGMDVADVAGVDPKTYRKVRRHVYGSLRTSLIQYWDRMGVAIRQAAIDAREAGRPPATSRYSEGRGFNMDEDFTGTGNFVAVPRNAEY